MILITWGTKVVPIGARKDFCERCQQDRTHEVFLVYGVLGLGYIFNLVNGKTYHWRCTRCGSEGEADREYIESEFPDVPIPALDRYGCLIFIVLFIVVVLGATCLQGVR